MTATAPPPGTMARRAIPRTAVPAMTAPGQPTALRGPDALPRHAAAFHPGLPRHAARCPAGTFPARHAAPAHGAGNAQGPGPGRTRPFSGTAADAPSPRTRPPFPSRPAAVPIPPLAALRPCSPCRTARQRDRPQRRCLRHQRPLSPPRGQAPRQRTGRPPRPRHHRPRKDPPAAPRPMETHCKSQCSLPQEGPQKPPLQPSYEK